VRSAEEAKVNMETKYLLSVSRTGAGVFDSLADAQQAAEPHFKGKPALQISTALLDEHKSAPVASTVWDYDYASGSWIRK
jgi:hypothetical protein